jgi:hypothetical protein
MIQSIALSYTRPPGYIYLVVVQATVVGWLSDRSSVESAEKARCRVLDVPRD